MAPDSSVILAGARTPVGRLLGSLRGFSAADLGGLAIEAALSRAGIAGADVDQVILGQVLQAGAGQLPARQAAVRGGIPMSVPATVVNKVCLSGIDSLALADALIRAGEAEVIVAGGMESMTSAPHLLTGLRAGVKFGDSQAIDSLAYDGLRCAFDQVSMGAATDRYNARHGVTREAQDAFSARSHQRAQHAAQAGWLKEEIVPVPIPQRKGEPITFDADEGVRPDTTAESLGRLSPAFDEHGTITAGSASQVSDGACAMVVTSRRRAESLGLPWLAEIAAQASVAGPDPSLHEQPAHAIEQALLRLSLDPSALDLVEINEAFAAVALVSQQRLGLPDDIVNVDGGAIAIGHPLGMSGARIALHLAYALRRTGGSLGAAALCGGGGQGQALVLRTA